MFERYSILARQAVALARKEAGQAGIDQIASEHLLIGVMSVHPELSKLLGTSIEMSHLRKQCEQWHTPSAPISDSRDLPVSPELERVFDRALSIAEERECKEIRTEHLLLSMAEEPCHAAQMIANCGMSKEPLLALVASVYCGVPQLATESSLRALLSIANNPS